MSPRWIAERFRCHHHHSFNGQALDAPIVSLINDVEGIAAARTVIDNVQIGRIAADHLVERGFKHLTFRRRTPYGQRNLAEHQAKPACTRNGWARRDGGPHRQHTGTRNNPRRNRCARQYGDWR